MGIESNEARTEPSKADAAAVIFMITQDSARANSIVHEDGTKFLEQ